MNLPAPLVDRLSDFAKKSLEPGHATFEMQADERHHNPMSTAASPACGWLPWNRPQS